MSLVERGAELCRAGWDADKVPYGLATALENPSQAPGPPWPKLIVEQGTYGDYGAYKRDAAAEPAPVEKREPEAEPEAKAEAKPQYGTQDLSEHSA